MRLGLQSVSTRPMVGIPIWGVTVAVTVRTTRHGNIHTSEGNMPVKSVPLSNTDRHSLEAYLGRVYDGLVVLVLHLVLGVHHHHQVRQPHLDGRKSGGEMAEIPVPCPHLLAELECGGGEDLSLPEGSVTVLPAVLGRPGGW